MILLQNAQENRGAAEEEKVYKEGLRPGRKKRERRHRYVHCEKRVANVSVRHWSKLLGRLVVIRVGVGRRNIDGSVVQVRVVRRERVVGGHGEGEPECVFAVEVEPEQPLLSDKTEGFVQGQSCRVIIFGLEYNLRNIVTSELNVRSVRDVPLTSCTPSCFIFSTDCRISDVAGVIR